MNEQLESIINRLYPNFLTHGVLSNLTRTVTDCLDKKPLPYWRKPEIKTMTWLADRLVIHLEQEEYCCSTCWKDEKPTIKGRTGMIRLVPEDEENGRCQYGSAPTTADLEIEYDKLKPFLNTNKELLIQMIDNVPDVVAKLCNKPLKSVKKWQYNQF